MPARLSRQDLFAAAQGQGSDPITAFLWTMAWGHNANGAGAVRTNKICADSNIAAKLSRIVGDAQSGNTKGAFKQLHGQSRLSGLATSFGSKLIYFAGFDPNSPSAQPLILDQLVAIALGEVIDPASGRSAIWSSQTRNWNHYWAYCELVEDLRDHYAPSHRIDLVEHWLWLHGGGWCWHRGAIRRNLKYPLP